MKVYKLLSKIENPPDFIIQQVYDEAKCESFLSIDENYFIERYVNKTMLFYVHHRCLKVFKICIYKKV